jgi:AcrR family transcriptional regulator
MSESAIKARTRRAILDAAVSTLARDPSASLGDVATAAGVGRTTLHRYFADRSHLLAAVSAHLQDQICLATERAALNDGSAPDALLRLCSEYLELGDVLTLMFNDPSVSTDETWQEAEHDRELSAAIERGQAEGTVDPELSAAWIQYTLWALLYSAWSMMREQSLPRHEAFELCRRSLAKLVAAP